MAENRKQDMQWLAKTVYRMTREENSERNESHENKRLVGVNMNKYINI
jgi:hypothetical protein